MDAAPRLVIIAADCDVDARGLAVDQASAGAVLLVPRDLSQPGWQFQPGGPRATVAVAGGRRFRLAEVRGILVRLAAVAPVDLPHIHIDDRAYVAAEVTAFLLALLTSIDVPVLNRPTPQCLCGPAWQEAKWRRVAATLGLPVHPLEIHAAPDLVPASPAGDAVAVRVTVVGETCIGAPNADIASATAVLARRAAATMLTVEFDSADASAAILRATPQVDLANPRVAAAVLGLFGMAETPPRRRREDRRDSALGT